MKDAHGSFQIEGEEVLMRGRQGQERLKTSVEKASHANNNFWGLIHMKYNHLLDVLCTWMLEDSPHRKRIEHCSNEVKDRRAKRCLCY